MDEIYKNIDERNLNKKRKILTGFDAMIADMLINKKLNPIATELFIRKRKLKISLVFVTQSFFAVPKNMRLHSTHYFLWKFQIKESFNKLHFIISRFWLERLYKPLQKMYCKTIFFFSDYLMLFMHQIIIYISERMF